MKHILNFLVCLVCGVVMAAPELPHFAQGDLDTFITQVVVKEDQEQFKKFYQTAILKEGKQKRASKGSKGKANLTYERKQLGQNSLEVRNPHWAAQLSSVSNQEVKHKKQIDAFFFRYGAYEEFCKQKAEGGTSLLVRARSYARDMSGKLTGWFGKLRRKPQTNAESITV